jgi:hypothetical protein
MRELRRVVTLSDGSKAGVLCCGPRLPRRLSGLPREQAWTHGPPTGFISDRTRTVSPRGGHHQPRFATSDPTGYHDSERGILSRGPRCDCQTRIPDDFRGTSLGSHLPSRLDTTRKLSDHVGLHRGSRRNGSASTPLLTPNPKGSRNTKSLRRRSQRVYEA